jgi:hypothetical protein
VAFTYYKNEISEMIIKDLREKRGLEVRMRDISISFTESWPNSTIYLYDAQFRSLKGKNEPFFTASTMGLSLSLKNLLQRELLVNSVILKDGTIRLIIEEPGKNNFTLLKTKDSADYNSLMKFDVQKIKLENMHFLLMNKKFGRLLIFNLKNILITPSHYYSNAIKARMQGDMYFRQLLFKPTKGPFLYHKAAQVDFSICWFKEFKSVFIDHSSSVEIDDQKYSLSAYVVYEDKPASLILRVTGKDLDPKRTIPILNTNLKKVMSQFNIRNTVDADVLIHTYLGRPREPQIVATITGKNNTLAIGDSKIPYSNVSFTARVINVTKPGKEADLAYGKVIIKHVRGNIYKFPFTAEIIIDNLEKSHINLKAEINANLAKFDLNKNQKLKLSGFCNAKINYTGPTRYITKNDFLNDSMKLDADIYFKRVTIKPGKKSPEYSLNGTARVINNVLRFVDLIFKTAGGNIYLSGEAPGFTTYASGITKGFSGKIKARTNYLDITPLLVKDETVKAKNYSKEINKVKKSDFEFNIDLNAKQLRFRKFDAYSANAHINFTNSDIIVPHFNMSACEGTLSGKAWLENFSDLTANVKLKDMNITTLFQQSENFSQKAITDKNLQGRISSTIDINTQLNSSFAVEPTSTQGKIVIKLSNGHLLNYEPLQNVSKFIFRNRNFDDISFTEINETLDLKGTQMTINEFELASNVVNMYVEGVYNFRGESNINMRIPWSNLKKRKGDYVAKNLGEEGKDDKGLKLNYHGTPGKMKLKLGNK